MSAVNQVADTPCEGGSSGTIVFGSTPASNALIVLIVYDQSSPTFTVNTSGFTQAIVQTNGNKKIQMWYKKLTSAENSFQVSNSGGTSVGRMVAYDLDADDIVDVTGGDTFNGTSVQSGPITTTEDDSVVISAFVEHQVTSGVSNSNSFNIDADVDRGAAGSKILASTQSVECNWSWTGSGAGAAIIAAFGKAGGGGGGGFAHSQAVIIG